MTWTDDQGRVRTDRPTWEVRHDTAMGTVWIRVKDCTMALTPEQAVMFAAAVRTQAETNAPT
jgi:hypothetical protein